MVPRIAQRVSWYHYSLLRWQLCARQWYHDGKSRGTTPASADLCVMIQSLGLSGKRGSGKDTVARLIRQLQPERNWQVLSFGDAIKAVEITA